MKTRQSRGGGMMKLCRNTIPLFTVLLFSVFPVRADDAGVTTSRDAIFPQSAGTSSPAAPSAGAQAAPARTQTAPAGTQTAPAATQSEPEASDTDSSERAAAPTFYPMAHDPYSGLGYSVVEKADYRSGRLKVSVNGSMGSFGMYEIREDGKEIPILSSYDFFSSTAFMLRIGRKEYLLNYAGGVKSEARRTEAGLQIAYTIPGKAFFLVDFTFPAAGAGRPMENAVQVNMYTVNLGDNPQTFTSKAVFDTILGESSSQHFSTYESPELNTQRKFGTMKNDRWICSTNKVVAIGFLLYGADISEPGNVSLGPIASLSESWEPTINEGKGFSTVLSYNNSGVAMNWKTAYLLPGQTDRKLFYITTADGTELLDALESGSTKLFARPENSQESEQTARAVPVTAEAEPSRQPLSPAAQAVTEDQLDLEYIQNLIDYIESLQEAGSVNREEYTSLNEELDAIFEKLRSMGN